MTLCVKRWLLPGSGNCQFMCWVEAATPFLLIVGLLTRCAAATQVIAMLVAVFVVHWSNGLTGPGGYQWALLMAAASACLLFEGAGKASIDRSFGGSGIR